MTPSPRTSTTAATALCLGGHRLQRQWDNVHNDRGNAGAGESHVRSQPEELLHHGVLGYADPDINCYGFSISMPHGTITSMPHGMSVLA